MKRFTPGLLLALVLSFPVSSLAITANDWKGKMSDEQQVAFVMGVLDAWRLTAGYMSFLREN
jgi:hypothetical protein